MISNFFDVRFDGKFIPNYINSACKKMLPVLDIDTLGYLNIVKGITLFQFLDLRGTFKSTVA